MATPSPYPTASKDQLIGKYVGKNLRELDTPAAVLDLTKVTANCARMIAASEKLGFGWRAHIKTHKTTELTRLQVGSSGPVNIIVSTILEAENILPLLLEYKKSGRSINLLYSFPVSPSNVPRLSVLAKALGPKNLSLLVDHPSQFENVSAIYEKSGVATSIFLKIDMGYHRAGVIPQTEACSTLIYSLLSLEQTGVAHFLGLYAHAGQSYSSNSSATAIEYLRQEFEALLVTAIAVQSASSPSRRLVLSVGATPTTTSTRNLLINTSEDLDTEEGKAISALRATINTIRGTGCDIEVHAGVYCVLDLQQLATCALPGSVLTWDDLAFTITAEVVSLYPGRGKDGTTEVLVGSGSLALGREPCKAYSGWGILTTWNRKDATLPATRIEEHAGWQVGKVSQEHGILQWTGPVGKEEQLEIGQKIRIWPNHACVAGAGFGWYLVVDTSLEGREDEIVDVWPRWNGW